MNHVQILKNTVLALSLTAATGTVHGAQARRPAGESAAGATVKVSLTAAGQSLTSSGAGRCTHADKAAIYGVMSEMWTVRQQADGRSTQLTVWRPMDGKEEMFSLSLSGAKELSVSTVRGGTVTGSGTVKFQARDKGGTFTINAKAKTGETVSGTIECSAFSAAVAEGGNL
jgi:hypothetical protein